MTTFDNREKDFEAKFKHDAELKFKATARRNKLLGLWAAEQLGMDGDDADAYARQVIESDFEEPGEEDVFRKVFGDLEAKLRQLKAWHTDGLITSEEYELKKRALLDGM